MHLLSLALNSNTAAAVSIHHYFANSVQVAFSILLLLLSMVTS